MKTEAEISDASTSLRAPRSARSQEKLQDRWHGTNLLRASRRNQLC